MQFRWFTAFDTLLYDFLVRQHTVSYPDDIVIVAIDERSLESLGAWPWDRKLHAELLQQLTPADAVVFDIIFSEPQSPAVADASVTPRQSDAALASMLQTHGRVFLPMYIEQQQFAEFVREVLPIPQFAEKSAGIGHVNVAFDSDGIVRGVYQRSGLGRPYWPHLASAVANHVEGVEVGAGGAPAADTLSPYQLSEGEFSLLRFVGTTGSIFSISYKDVLAGLIPASQFSGKRVFVGATAKGLGDNIATPMGVMPGVEFHAQAYQALRLQQEISPIPHNYYLLLVVVLVALICFSLSHFSPTLFLLGSLLVGIAVMFTVAVLFLVWSYWVGPSPVIFAILCFYPLWSWRRISIALSYLRDELATLKLQTESGSVSVDSITNFLEPMRESGLLLDAELELISAESNSWLPRWPDRTIKDCAVKTAIFLNDSLYQLRLESPLSGRHADLVLRELLEGTPAHSGSLGDSYELVERTIEEISRAKVAVDRAQRQMNQSMRHLQDAVVVCNAAGQLIFYNESAATLFGTTLSDQGSIADLQPSLGKLIWGSLLRRVMLESETVYQEIDTAARQKLLCQAAPVITDEASSTIFVFVFTDVTQIRELERDKNEALAFLSHDMRSPMVSQLALIQSARSDQRAEPVVQPELLSRLASFAEKSLKYAEDFLQLARAENLDEERFQLVDMHGVVDAAHANIVNQANLAGIAIRTQRTEDDCWILGDAQLLERALTNLLQNAVQHSGSRGEVGINLRHDGDVVVEVADYGAGIDADLLPNLFEPYFRVREQSRRRGDMREPEAAPADTRNYGLGLSFVHSVVMRHGGKIDVESEMGIGTKFSLAFPATTVE